MTSLGARGAGVLHLVPLLTSQLHYGLFDPGGCVEMRLSFDHRVLDGAAAARALADLEAALLGEVLNECGGPARPGQFRAQRIGSQEGVWAGRPATEQGR